MKADRDLIFSDSLQDFMNSEFFDADPNTNLEVNYAQIKGDCWALGEPLYCVPFGSFWFANTGQQNRQKNCGDSLPLKWSYSPDFGSSSNTLYSFCSQGSTDQKNQIFFFFFHEMKVKEDRNCFHLFLFSCHPRSAPVAPSVAGLLALSCIFDWRSC